MITKTVNLVAYNYDKTRKQKVRSIIGTAEVEIKGEDIHIITTTITDANVGPEHLSPKHKKGEGSAHATK